MIKQMRLLDLERMIRNPTFSSTGTTTAGGLHLYRDRFLVRLHGKNTKKSSKYEIVQNKTLTLRHHREVNRLQTH